ncbi:hypothetical protein J6590_003370 [Homalodisca vitripennis]|nr:hypothetical protein J6590_003370 [Homalodisca vitripennis]
MPAICIVCSVTCESDSSEVKCCANCKRCYHLQCIKDDVDVKKTRSASKEWLCKECRKSASATSSISSSASSNLTKEFLIQVLDEFKNEVFGEIQIFRKEVSDIKTSIEFLSDAVDKSSIVMKAIQTDLTAMKKENLELKKQNNMLQSEVDGHSGISQEKVQELSPGGFNE